MAATPKTLKSIITVCADSVEKLRACDVYRALELAKQEGLEHALAGMLDGARPDLKDEVEEALAELAEA